MTHEEPKDNPVLQAPPGLDGQSSPDGNGRVDGPVDEASVSVSRALHTSFLALKLVLLGLVIIYLGSGYFQLQTGQKAVVVRFGKIQGEGTAAGPVLTEGAHWTWPWPISHQVIADTERTRTLKVDSLWFFLDQQLRGMPIEQVLQRANPPEQLQPGLDGYLLTGEQEIVHLKCEVRYKIDDLVKYVTNVNTDPHEVKVAINAVEYKHIEVPGDEYLIQTIAEWAATQTVAGLRTDEAIYRDDPRLRIKQLMQQRLDDLGSGIGVIDVIFSFRTVPLQVRPGQLAVVQAENKKAETIANARRDATQRLYEVAGPTHEELANVIQAYERARTLGDQAQADAGIQKIMALLDQAGGLVANSIVTARAESSWRREQIQAELSRFHKAYPQYLRNPSVFMAQYWADIKQQILASPDVERIFLPYGSKEIRLNLGHNPEYLKQAQVRKYTEQAGAE